MVFDRPVRRAQRPLALLWVLYALGCGSGSAEYSGPLPSPDGEQFVDEVYPMLLRNCAFVECHGVEERFFQIYGPGRVRMDPDEVIFSDPLTLEEVLYTYDRAISMLASSEDVENSLLLRKPLEAQAGGQGHKGVDDMGRNIFASKDDPEWKALLDWAKSEGSRPTQEQIEAIMMKADSGELDEEIKL